MLFEKTLSSLSPLWALTNTVVRPVLSWNSQKLEKPVISVGNIVAGGTGKTELAIKIAQALIELKKRVVVSQRGYKSLFEITGGISQDYQLASQLKFSDEALVVLRKAPGVQVAVGKNRTNVLRKHWEELSPDVIILDDGFQHFELKRNLDILIHDFNIKFPILRDFPMHFKKVSLQVTLSPVPTFWKHLDWVEAHYELKGMVNALGQKSPLPKEAFVLCGIGNPERFKASLEEKGVRVKSFCFLPDHYCYSNKKLQKILNWQKQGGGFPLLTTLKDYVKIEKILLSQGKHLNTEIYWIELDFCFTKNEKLFWDRIHESLAVSRT